MFEWMMFSRFLAGNAAVAAVLLLAGLEVLSLCQLVDVKAELKALKAELAKA
jgi:hypothetical protein